MFPFRNVPRSHLALVEVSDDLHDAISSRDDSTDSYQLRSEWMAGLLTVHLIGQKGFSEVKPCSDYVIFWDINLNVPN